MFNSISHRLSCIAQILLALLFCLAMPAAQAHSGAHEPEPQHQVMQASGGDFTLASATGPVALSDFHGKVVLIYFGYTHCTDICPTVLGKFGSALKSMKPKEVAQIQPIFITVDPARDNAQHMAAFSAAFHPKLIGLTGTEAEIAAVAQAYGFSYKKGPVNADGNYEMAHPSAIYLVGRDGKPLARFPYDSSPERTVAILRKALK